MQIYIETDRLILRPIEAADRQGIFELDSDPEVHRYLGKKPIKSLPESEAVINYIQQQYEEDGIGRWAVIDRRTNEFIGWSGLKYERKVRPEMPYYDLGYRLKRKFWGKGIATETALEALNYGFRTMGLEEIYAGAHVENIGSNKVLQKVGLTFMETFEYDHAPHNWYRIGKNEWQEKMKII
ncbi:MAG: GNAT family N-acetyltransferase [Phaeodactylibacter sp.]|nr:GNAT family N-acetyltransferase [Phaeodactylibacter sp.]